jgi:hypothetical protein
MFEINFNSYDHNFCESTIYSVGQHPEYLNTISSLFITFIGINGLRKSNLSLLLSMLYSCLSVNGILSFLYHYYNSIGYGLLDRMSMVLLALNTTYIFINSIKMIPDIKISKIKNIFIYIIVTTYYSILLTAAGLHKETLFNVMFGLFLISIICYINIIQLYFNNIIDNKVLKFGWKGIRCIIFSCIFWLGTEALCNNFSFIKYLFGHVWWHIFVSYGGYLVSIIPQYIYMVKNQDDMIVCICYDMFGIPYLDYNNIV